MTEEEVLVDGHYIRGCWMLDKQVSTVDDLVRFWKVFGVARVNYPSIELCPDWDMVQ